MNKPKVSAPTNSNFPPKTRRKKTRKPKWPERCPRGGGERISIAHLFIFPQQFWRKRKTRQVWLRLGVSLSISSSSWALIIRKSEGVPQPQQRRAPHPQVGGIVGGAIGTVAPVPSPPPVRAGHYKPYLSWGGKRGQGRLVELVGETVGLNR